ncbi:MAG: hypothetical protein LBT59_04670 [Clostridiales bacterium]|jgi:hypothetical protein|nr:hypothetical protein [Clostridiales bacterium]
MTIDGIDYPMADAEESNTFITSIRIDHFEEVDDFDIPLAIAKHRHFVITDDSGARCTRLIRALLDSIRLLWDEVFPLSSEKQLPVPNAKLSVSYSKAVISSPDVPLFYFSAPRLSTRARGDPSDDTISNLLDSLEAFQNNPFGADKSGLYRECFPSLQAFLQKLMKAPYLSLKVGKTQYDICIPDKDDLPIHQMSTGLVTVLNIYVEMAKRLAILNGCFNNELPAIAIIDALGSSISGSMQSMIFPLLVNSFPKVQFIFSTTKWYTIKSLQNAVMLDLSKKRLYTYI